ncbi:hypothetical protein [Gordonia malaquae]|uniref:hypothetical protein n=1 Tax=Gordonia malaquae TaxID=410332 RepID=UPI00301B1FB6
MSESFLWDGDQLTVHADARVPYRVCGTEITFWPDKVTDEHGHAIGYVHLTQHVAVWAAINVIHDLHQPNPEGIVPWCPTCKVQSPCETRRITTAAMEIKP